MTEERTPVGVLLLGAALLAVILTVGGVLWVLGWLTRFSEELNEEDWS